MSPQSTLSRRSPTGVLDLTHDFAPVRQLRAAPNPELPKARPTRPYPAKTDLLPPLVISLAPPFERAIPLPLVEADPRRKVGMRTAKKTLTAGHIRLTRRGRLALLVAVVLCMLVGFLLGDVLSSTAGSMSPPAASHSIVVQPGQTLWGIATQVAPHADPRATVQQIIVLNHLPSTGLEVGETLAVPS
jgi:LysM repeat protein